MIDGVEVRPDESGGMALFATRCWSPGEVLLWLSGELHPKEAFEAHPHGAEHNRIVLDGQVWYMVRFKPTEYSYIQVGDNPNLEEELVQDNGLFFVRLNVIRNVQSGDRWVR